MRSINLGVRFGLEMAALVVAAVWGFGAADGGPVSWILAIVAPTAIAATWGRWVAPQSSHRLDDPGRLAVEVVVFGVAASALVAMGRPSLALVWTAVVVVNLALMFTLSQR